MRTTVVDVFSCGHMACVSLGRQLVSDVPAVWGPTIQLSKLKINCFYVVVAKIVSSEIRYWSGDITLIVLVWEADR